MMMRRGWAAGLAAGMLLAGLGSARAADIDRLLPDNVQFICTMQVSQILRSPLARKYAIPPIKALLETNEELQQYLESLGFDPLKDISRVVLAVTQDEEQLLILRGHFDTAKVEARSNECVKMNRELMTRHKNVLGPTIYEVKGPEAGEGETGGLSVLFPCPEESLVPVVGVKGSVFFALADKATIVASSTKDGVRDALARALQKKKPALTREMQHLLKKVDTHASLWMAEYAGKTQEGASTEEQEADTTTVDAVTASMTVTDDVHIKLVMSATDIDAARDLVKSFKNLRTLAQACSSLMAVNGKGLEVLKDMPKSIQVTRHGRVVTVEGHIAAAVFDKLIEMTEPE